MKMMMTRNKGKTSTGNSANETKTDYRRHTIRFLKKQHKMVALWHQDIKKGSGLEPERWAERNPIFWGWFYDVKLTYRQFQKQLIFRADLEKDKRCALCLTPVTPKQLFPWLLQLPRSASRHVEQHKVWSDKFPSQKTSIIFEWMLYLIQQTRTWSDLSTVMCVQRSQFMTDFLWTFQSACVIFGDVMMWVCSWSQRKQIHYEQENKTIINIIMSS